LIDSFFLTKWLFLGMRWIYDVLQSISLQGGFAIFMTILIATLSIKGLTLFSDIKSRKSQLKTQAIQPELDKLKKKYANDAQRLNQEQRKFMKEKGVSTFAGCLPMLIMMPLFFMFIAAFRHWSNEQMLRLLLQMDANPEAGLELFAGYRFLWIHNIWRPDNITASVLMSGEEFFKTFSDANVQNFVFYSENAEALNALLLRMGYFVQDANGALQVAANNALFIKTYDRLLAPCIDLYAGYVNGWAILPLLAGGTTFLSSWLTMRNQPKPAEGQPGMGKSMMYIMPAISVFFCWSAAATFALYWTFSNVISTGVTMAINASLNKKSNQVEVIKI